jgi:hypothetical protein
LFGGGTFGGKKSGDLFGDSDEVMLLYFSIIQIISFTACVSYCSIILWTESQFDLLFLYWCMLILNETDLLIGQFVFLNIYQGRLLVRFWFVLINKIKIDSGKNVIDLELKCKLECETSFCKLY